METCRKIWLILLYIKIIKKMFEKRKIEKGFLCIWVDNKIFYK